jgi:acyl carrier protein
MKDQIRRQIVDFIIENFLFDVTDGDVSETESLLDTGVIDSTGVLELVSFIEETYGFKVEDEEIVPDNLDTVANICTYVLQKLGTAYCAVTQSAM